MSSKTPALLARFDSSRILILGGIFLVMVGMIFGEIYAIYISHFTNSIIKNTWTSVIDATNRGDTAAVRDYFATIYDLADKRGRIMNTHSHIGGFGLLALAMAIIQPALSLTNQTKHYLAVGFLLGAILQSGFVYLSYYLGSWALYLSDVGAVLVSTAVAGTLLTLLTHSSDKAQSLGEMVLQHVRPAASRFLLRAGLLLILSGMIFGLYHAWQMKIHDEKAAYHTIDAAVEKLEQRDNDSAKKLVANFKAQQSRMAITAAAHSHAIEFGFLMVLLAFIQSYVFLEEPWCLRWAKILTTGAFLLPVCVFLATLYGLRAAIFADLSGALVISGLFAMSYGIVRYTGVSDIKTNGCQ